jgi:hypothetical protein
LADTLRFWRRICGKCVSSSVVFLDSLLYSLHQVRAIDPPPQLRHCRGLLIFSIKGDRPLADMLSGGGMSRILQSRPTSTQCLPTTTRLRWWYTLHSSTVLRGVQLAVPDIGEVSGNRASSKRSRTPTSSTPSRHSIWTPALKKDTVLVDELLDRLKHVSEADRTSVDSQHLLVSIGEPELFKRCKSVFAICRVPGLSNGPPRLHQVQQGDDHSWK